MQISGVVADAFSDNTEHLRPDSLMVLPVLDFGFRAKSDDRSATLHGVSRVQE